MDMKAMIIMIEQTPPVKD